MKRLMILTLGLCLALSPLATTFAQDNSTKSDTDKGKGKSKADPKKQGGKRGEPAKKS